MAKTALLQARIEPALKKQGEEVLREIGLSNTEFMTMTFRQLVMRQGLPFEAKIPNEETIAAFEESERDYKAGRLKSYTSTNDMMTDILDESDS